MISRSPTPYANSLQCPIGTIANCFLTLNGNTAPWTNNLALLPGALHAYTASLNGFVAAQAVPEPGTGALALLGLAGAVAVRRKRRGLSA